MTNPYKVCSGTASSSSSTTTTVTTATTAGDVIVVSAYVSAGIPASAKDTQGNSYILVTPPGSGGEYQFVSTGKTKALALTDTITVTGPGSAGVMNTIVIGVPGAAYAGVDVCAVTSGTGSGGSLTAGPLIYAGGQIVIVAGVGAASITISGGGYAQLGSANNGTNPHWTSAGWASLPPGSTTGAAFSLSLASAAWGMSAVTLMLYNFVGNAPVPPTQQAGTVATSADMNTLALSSLFLRRPPMVIAQANVTQAVGTSQTALTWNLTLRDTDGFWTPGVNPSRLTVQTPGFYKVRYQVPFNSAANNCFVVVRVTTTSANPLGAGTQPFWYGWAGSSTVPGSAVGGGDIPFPLVAGDYVEILAQFNVASSTVISPAPASCTLRMVSA